MKLIIAGALAGVVAGVVILGGNHWLAQRKKEASAAQARVHQQELLASQRRTCNTQLVLLENAIQEWAIEHNKPDTAGVQRLDLISYLKGGWPQCPSGGSYALKDAGSKPTCTIHRKQSEPFESEPPSPAAITPEPEATNSPASVKLRAPEEYGQQAYYFAREVCKRSLKSPSSAKFSNPLNQADTGWTPDGYYQWKVGGRVESQNSFGASFEEKWFAVVQYNLGKFEVVYLNIGGQESGKQPAMRRAPGY